MSPSRIIGARFRAVRFRVVWFLGAVAVNVAIVVALTRLAADPVDVTPIAPTGAPRALEDQRPNPDGATAPDFSGLDRNQVLARPLFAMGRRPWQSPAPPPPEPVAVVNPATAAALEPERPPDIILLGVGIADSGARALLIDATGTASVWVAEGEMFGDWTVRDISDQTVTIERDRRSVSLNLYPAAAAD